MAKKWMEEEIEFLKEWYPTSTPNSCAEILERTLSSIHSKASKLGLKNCYKPRKTTSSYREELIGSEYEVLEDYITALVAIKHKHLVCGFEWKVRPGDISHGKGCPKCAGTMLKTTEKYKMQIPEGIELLEEYKCSRTPIKHKHQICGNIWEVRPDDILKGRGCPVCANRGFQSNKPGTLYFIHFPILGLYKLGITNNLNKRLKNFNYTANIINTRTFELGSTARELERNLFIKFKSYLYNSEELSTGNTETLLDPPVESVISTIQSY